MTGIVYYAYQADTYCPECVLRAFGFEGANRDVEEALDDVAQARGIDRATADTNDFPHPSHGEDGLYDEEGHPRVCGACLAAFDDAYESPEGDLARWLFALEEARDADFNLNQLDLVCGPERTLARAVSELDVEKEDLAAVLRLLVPRGATTPVRLSAHELSVAASRLYASYGDGWEGIAIEHVEDHWPGFPTQWINLEGFGRALRREDMVYVEVPEAGPAALSVFRAEG